MFRWTGSVGVLAVALTLALAAPAGAATGFLTDDTLTSAGAGAFDIAMAPNGYAIAGWVEGASGAQVVRVSTRPPGGDWSAPETFPVSLDYSSSVSVAIASSGAAAVTWGEVTTPITDDVGIATRAPGGAFTRAEVLSGARQIDDPSVGVAADGTVTLLYTNNPDAVVRDFAAGSSVLAATEQPLAASCSTGFGSGIAEAPNGDAVVPLYCGGASFALRRGGSWAVSPTVPNDIPGGCSSTTTYDAPSAAIDADGDPVGVMQRTSTQRIDLGGGGCMTTTTTIDALLVLPLGGVMTPVSTPVASGSSFGDFGPFPISGPEASIAPSGIVFSWGATDMSFRSQANARFFAPDGSGGSATQPVGQQITGSLYPRLALAANGRGLLSWAQSDGTTISLVAAERAPGASAFGAPGPLASGRDLGIPMLALDDVGDGLAAWTQGSGPVSVHVRGYDAAAPTLGGVSIPASATAGTPATFSASPFDVWGPLTTTWSFGDGSTATGTAVTHTYERAGTFTASVTSTDAVGNAVTRSATVQVSGVGGGGGSSTAGGAVLAIRGLSLTHRRFRVGRSATAVSARRRRAPVGTTFRFTVAGSLSVRAPPGIAITPPPLLVRIAFARQATGLRGRAGACVRPSRRLRGARARRCTRLVPVRPTLSRRASLGANAVPFSGRIGRRALRPGSYRATLTPIFGSAGPPSSIGFRVVR